MQFKPEQQQALLAYATALRQVTTPTAKEFQALEVARKNVERARSAAGSAQLAIDDMELEITRLQQDGQKLRRRLQDNQSQLATAEDPELRRDLQHDISSTTQRITDLTSQIQEAHNEMHALRMNLDKHQQQLKDYERAAEKAEAEYKAAAAINPEEALAALRSAVPQELLSLFEEQKTLNGMGVAAFTGRSCGGCYLVLSPAEVSAIKAAPAHELPVCPECGSYLVR